MHQRAVDAVALDMLGEAAFHPVEVSRRLEGALDIEYWRALVPEASVGRSHPVSSSDEVWTPNVDVGSLAEQVAREGYFQQQGMYPPSLVERMRNVVETLRSNDWHPVFAFVYDEFWDVCRMPPTARLLSALLGPGFRQTPKTWCHYVPPVKGARGWPPHIDDRPTRRKLTVWIALTDATLDNGCICVVPKDRVSSDLVANWHSSDTVSRDQMSGLLQSARPLPAHAGSMLGWEMGVIHWGSVSRQSGVPRVSVSYDFIAAAEPPLESELPLLTEDGPPAFADRITLIARNIVDYRRFEPSLSRYHALAEQMMSEAR